MDYCRNILTNIHLEKRLSPDETLVHVLRQLEDAGHTLWVMTNADRSHAVMALELLGLKSFFINEDRSRVIDVFQLWELTQALHGEPMNKPAVEAYRVAEAMVGASGSDCVMVEDSMVNLVAPRQLGWRTVWVSQGRPTPADSCADYVISSAKDMIGVLEKIAAGSAKAPKRNSEQAGAA